MLLKITSARLVDIALSLRVHTSDDTSFRVSDEADDGISFFRFREAEFDLCEGIREVRTSIVNDVIHILDAADLV